MTFHWLGSFINHWRSLIMYLRHYSSSFLVSSIDTPWKSWTLDTMKGIRGRKNSASENWTNLIPRSQAHMHLGQGCAVYTYIYCTIVVCMYFHTYIFCNCIHIFCYCYPNLDIQSDSKVLVCHISLVYRNEWNSSVQFSTIPQKSRNQHFALEAQYCGSVAVFCI